MSDSRTNEDWIAALRRQDERALADLREYLCRNLQRVLAGRPGQSDAEDFAQQAVQRILDSLGRFRGDSTFTTWASAIAIRIAISELRRKRWGSVSLDALLEKRGGLETVVPAMQPKGGAQTAREELIGALRNAIVHALTERQRALVLAELQGMPTAVLCDELGMTRGAAYKMYHDARKRLRRHLEENGFSVEDVRFVVNGASHTP